LAYFLACVRSMDEDIEPVLYFDDAVSNKMIKLWVIEI